MSEKLTQSFVQSLTPKAKQYLVFDTECSGFYVCVGKAKKTYFYKYQDSKRKQYKYKIGETSALTATQARILANHAKARLAMGESIVPEKPKAKLTLGDFITNIYSPERLISHPKAGQKTLNMIRSVFAKRFYDRYIDDLDIKDFNAWRNDRLAGGVKRVTVNKNTTALRAALKWGVENGYVEQNPLQGMKKLKETDAASKIRYLTEDERDRLFAALDARENRMCEARTSHNQWLAERGEALMPELDDIFADHLKPMVLVSLYSGIRQGTLFGLKWGDMDFESGILTMRGEIMKSGEMLRVPTVDIVFDTLAAWRDQSPNTNADALIFPSPTTGEQFKDISKPWHNLLKEAGIEKFRWHDMRHDFASQLVMKGVDLNTVCELMGHKDIKTTQIYAHLAPEHKLKAVGVLMDTIGNRDLLGGRASASSQ